MSVVHSTAVKHLPAPTLVCLTLGTGIGCGLLVNGRVHPSVEAGHAVVIPDGRPCGCGQNGCVEAYASASAIAKEANRIVSNGLQRREVSYLDLIEKYLRDNCEERDVFPEDKESILYRMLRQKIQTACRQTLDEYEDAWETSEALKRSELPKLTAREVFEAAIVHRDPIAHGIVSEAMRHLALLCVNLCRL